MIKKFSVSFKKSALKEFRQLPQGIQKRFLEIIELLSINPYTEILNIKKLKGADALYRVRTGDYRMIYQVENNTLHIVIIKVPHRKEAYE